MYDAVKFFATSLRGLIATQSMGPARITCNDLKPWLYGYSLMNYMKVVRIYRDQYIIRCIRYYVITYVTVRVDRTDWENEI